MSSTEFYFYVLFTIVIIRSKFYKLNKNSYNEITQFKTKQTALDECTSEKFKQATGFGICASVNRPTLESLESLNMPIDLERSFERFHNKHDLDEENNELLNAPSSDILRPLLGLSGPFKYEVKLVNEDSVKELQVKTQYSEVDKDNKSFKASFSTLTEKGTGADRLILQFNSK